VQDIFNDQDLQRLSDDIDNQLSELQKQPVDSIYKNDRTTRKTIPPKQKQLLEQATGENADSFLKKFAQVAKKDLCEKDGVLFQQWKKYGDLNNKDMLKTFGGVLVAMGITSTLLQTAVVAVSVITLHLGIKTICEENNER
jgi:hypothetical protein